MSDSTSADCWSKYPIVTWFPIASSPLSGGTNPAAVFKNVDFPTPLSPMIPIFCPRLTRRLSSRSGLSYPIFRCSASSTHLLPRTAGTISAGRIPRSSNSGFSIRSMRSSIFFLDLANAALRGLFLNRLMSSSCLKISSCCRL